MMDGGHGRWLSRSKVIMEATLEVIVEASHCAGRLSWRHIWEAGMEVPKTWK
jgi:hypothetical protein